MQLVEAHLKVKLQYMNLIWWKGPQEIWKGQKDQMVDYGR